MLNKEEKIFLTSMVEKLKRGFSTPFLNIREQYFLKTYLKNMNYLYLKPFSDSEYSLFYTEERPLITCFRVDSKVKLKHSDILGSLFALSIDRHLIGDIIINEESYFLVMASIASYIKEQLIQIGREYVALKEVPLETIEHYHYETESIYISVEQLRLDLVIAKLLHKSRSQVDCLIEDGFVLHNYEEKKKSSSKISLNDYLSIRHVGKFKITEILENKDKYVIHIKKYK